MQPPLKREVARSAGGIPSLFQPRIHAVKCRFHAVHGTGQIAGRGNSRTLAGVRGECVRMGGAELLHHIVRPDQLVTVEFQFLGCQQIGDVLFVYVIFQLQSLDILGQLGAVLECGTVCLGLLQLLLVVCHAPLMPSMSMSL